MVVRPYQKSAKVTRNVICFETGVTVSITYCVKIAAHVTIAVFNGYHHFLCTTDISNTMPPKTSKKIKELQQKLKLHDSQLTRAVDYARRHPKESKAKVARAFGVNPTTLRRGCKGTQAPRSKARQAQQLLTAGEEEAVVDWWKNVRSILPCHDTNASVNGYPNSPSSDYSSQIVSNAAAEPHAEAQDHP